MRRWLSVLSVSSLLLATSPAFADDPPTAPAPPAPPAAPAPPASTAGTAQPTSVPGPTPSEIQARRVPVTVESGTEKNAVLERRVTTEDSSGRILYAIPVKNHNETWEQVCVAPCRVELDRFSTYRVARANGMPATGEFTLPPGSESLKLEVDPGNLLASRIGHRLIAAGTAAAIVGGALLTAAPGIDDRDDEKHARLAGVITGGIGVLFLAIGIPLVIATQTHIKSGERKLAGSPPPNRPTLGPTGLTF